MTDPAAAVAGQCVERMSRQVNVQTFYLLWCEGCGHAREPAPPANQPEFVAAVSEPMRCRDCNETLHLIECFTAAETSRWHVAPGWPWQQVIYPEDLPKPRWPNRQAGRSRWIDP